MHRAYVIGSPIGHSISPAIHNAAFAACGIDARYEAVRVEPEGLAQWAAEARRQEVLGFNITLPHKETIIPLLDELRGDAAVMGAVNMVKVVEAGAALVGTNTDTLGFRRSLEEEGETTLRGQRALLLGAGGAARAVALVALQDGAESLWVANRRPERAHRFLEDLASITGKTQVEALALDGPRLAGFLRAATVVINATSVGLRSEELPADPSPIQPPVLVVDVIYNPTETAFLRAARQHGAQVLGGLGMLVHQAAAAFEEWTGVAAPISDMRRAADEALAAW